MQTVCNPLENIRLSEDIIPFTEFRRTLSSCFARTTGTHRPLIITQNGRAAKILLDIADFDGLKETLEIVEDVHVAEAEIKRGETISAEDLRAKLHAEREQSEVFA